MIKALLFDLSYTLLFPKDQNYHNELNKLHAKLSKDGDYDPHPYYYLDLEMLEFLSSIKEKYQLYIFTSGNIQNIPEFRKILAEVFEDVFSASELGLSKKDLESYVQISKKVKVKPGEILFIDDSKTNCIAAERAGLNVYHYQSREELIKHFDNIHQRLHVS